ncbi:hypothetical protein R3W88_004908 [Solanum pinnatisectum]|uniref:F-box domain-containing protein n=1 Tax=Solanum pinnatisectum TaxID=50273 RepID=A0AAV9KAL3_9SOLN|nr:hypothetical protein R3W88_004908 [Solanum pinnatisectum]
MSEKDQFPSSPGDDGNSESWLIENSPQIKAKIETECDETGLSDRISQLPDALIIQILSRLSITDVFRTTILSKHWQYFWTSIDNLVYDNEEFSRSDSSMVHKFISLTDNVLPLLSNSSIKKCSLNFVFKHENDVSYFLVIDKWLEFAVNKKVEGLCLNISYDIDAIEHDQPYSLPEVLCSSSSILKLKCQNCRILDDCILNWTSMKSLTLEGLLIRDEHIKQIMSNCPQLESFNLFGFCGLKLIDHYHPIGDWYSFEGDCCFEVVAPYVEHLTISGDFDYTEIELKDLSSLDHAKLCLCSDEFDSMDEDILIDLLVSIRCANELILSSCLSRLVISIWMMDLELNFSLSLLECRWLTISSYISKVSFPMLDKLLRSTPNLENLMIFPGIEDHSIFQDAEEYTEALELYDLLSFEENIFKVSLQNLKNVKVMPFCSGTRTSDATELDQFLKFLLEHAINLEKMVIVPKHKGCNSCSINSSQLMKCLLLFPRTSISAVISLGPITQNVFDTL